MGDIVVAKCGKYILPQSPATLGIVSNAWHELSKYSCVNECK